MVGRAAMQELLPLPSAWALPRGQHLSPRGTSRRERRWFCPPKVGVTARKRRSVSGLLGNRGGCEGELLEERGHFSGKCIFAQMKNSRRVPPQQRKAGNEMQSSSLPTSHGALLAGIQPLLALLTKSQHRFSLCRKRSDFRKRALWPAAQERAAGEAPYPMETAGGTVSLLERRDN